MTVDGFYNEKDFINSLNNKRVGQLNDLFVNMLEKVYVKKIDSNTYVTCQKSFKTDKADIIIDIDGIKKYISIKSGKNNSMHLEKISEFINFLKENNISQELINIYINYHYAILVDGKRLSAKEYQATHQKDIELFNLKINEPKILQKAINRFLFKGIHFYNNDVDAIIYGKINDFTCLTREEITKYLSQQKDKFDSIHFSLLTLQPWTRNLNYNSKYEYRREYVQVKWYRFEEIVKDIINFE